MKTHAHTRINNAVKAAVIAIEVIKNVAKEAPKKIKRGEILALAVMPIVLILTVIHTTKIAYKDSQEEYNTLLESIVDCNRKEVK